MTSTIELARTVSEECRRQGISRTDVINRTGVSRAAVYRFFKGEDVQLTTLLAITNLLGMNLMAIRSSVAGLMPDLGAVNPDERTAPPTPLRLGHSQHLPRAGRASQGPQSAVALRAERLNSQLKNPKP